MNYVNHCVSVILFQRYSDIIITYFSYRNCHLCPSFIICFNFLPLFLREYIVFIMDIYYITLRADNSVFYDQIIYINLYGS